MSSDGDGWVEVRLNEDDLAALSKYYHEETPAGRRRTRMMHGIAALSCVMWAFSVREHPKYGIADNPEGYALYVGIGVAVILVAFYALLWYARPMLARMSAGIGHRKGITQTTRFRAAPEGLLLQVEDRTGTAPWADITAVGRTSTHLYLLTIGINGFILPARCFDTEAAFDAFAASAAEYKRRSAGQA